MTDKHKKIKILVMIAALCCIFLIIPTIFSCSTVEPIENTEITVEKGIEVEVEIRQGMNLTQVADALEEKGIIDDAFVFRLYVQQQGKEKNLLPGTYTLVTGSEYEDILDVITAGEKQVIYKLIIPEGFNVNQVKERILADIPFIEEEDLESATDISNYSGYEFLKDKESLEGFLFPKTYDVTVDYSAQNIIEMMLTQYQLETRALDWTYAQENGYDEYDILKVASLIEREAYIPEERPLISAVIYNRLEIDMPLQIDATIQYALGEPGNWWPVITVEDYKIDSPYNTYKYAGLPPTPICNPGIAAMKAALAPADVEYLFYVVIDEETHEHKFSNTFEEHTNAANQ